MQHTNHQELIIWLQQRKYEHMIGMKSQDCHGVINHYRFFCLFDNFQSLRKTSKFRITGWPFYDRSLDFGHCYVNRLKILCQITTYGPEVVSDTETSHREAYYHIHESRQMLAREHSCIKFRLHVPTTPFQIVSLLNKGVSCREYKYDILFCILFYHSSVYSI